MKNPFHPLFLLACACSAPEPRREVMLSAGATPSAGLPRVSIQLTIADMPRARADQLFGAEDASGSEFGPEFSRRIDELVRAGAGVEIEHRPMLVLLDAHRGYIDVGNSESYVEDFVVDREHGIADPVVATLWEGLRFEAQPEIREDGDGVDLDFRLELTALHRPIPESVVELPDLGVPVTIQMPSCTSLAENRRITLRPGRVYAFVLEPESPETAGERAKVVTLEIGVLGPAIGGRGAEETVEPVEIVPH
jgi:hypothetical protein